MLNILRDYNRTYYKARLRIWRNYRWKIFKLFVIGKLLKLAYKVDNKIFAQLIFEIDKEIRYRNDGF